MDGTETDNKKVEIWAGTEYSLVRVGNDVYDQLAVSRHEERPGDLDLFSELGIKTIRYPLLWEKYATDKNEFFRVHDNRLNRLLELGIKPVAGLLHHGSGPFFTNLMMKDFPSLLAEYAFAIAERYPWIESYTPVNEPLTTARFSGLYGIWYPHLRDERSFVRIFVNELKGIVLSMKAVKSINPRAGLVQTEDLCRVFSTGMLRYQADFENERRWLTYDMLLGSLVPGHPMYGYFLQNGIGEEEMLFFAENKIIPEICGFNYYVTSERYLDQKTTIYPSWNLGGNGIHQYADVEAVRANLPVNIGPEEPLRGAWQRYHLPLALTEVHLACTREEQLRWFSEAYDIAAMLRNEGADIRAVTAWALLGAFDWNSLLCEKNNNYETGVFDIRSGIPRPTALAGLIKWLTGKGAPPEPVLASPGWWKRSDRFVFSDENEKNAVLQHINEKESISPPLLIVGAGGSLGSAFARVCKSRGLVTYLSERDHLDIASEEAVKKALNEIKPWAVVNAAGFTDIDKAEKSAYTCFRENTIGPVILAEACRTAGIKLLTFSADQVFNGRKNKPYSDEDHPHPLNLYGMSKRIAEEKILKINHLALIIRTGPFFNPWHPDDSLGKMLMSGLSDERRYYLPSDIIISPAYVPGLVNAALDLLIDKESGIWHLSGQDEISVSHFAEEAFRLAGIDKSLVTPVLYAGMKYAAARPAYSVLKSSSGIVLPNAGNALNDYLNEFFRETAYRSELSNITAL